jgi:hypothetical protein
VGKESNQEDRDGLSPFLIECGLSSLRQSASGSITCNFCVRVNGFVFPDRGWSDFVVVVLSGWFEAGTRLTRGQRTAELVFMDGPFVINVTSSGVGVCSIEFLRRETKQTLLKTATVETLQMVHEIDRVAAQVIERCEQHNFRSNALDELRNLISTTKH